MCPKLDIGMPTVFPKITIFVFLLICLNLIYTQKKHNWFAGVRLMVHLLNLSYLPASF